MLRETLRQLGIAALIAISAAIQVRIAMLLIDWVTIWRAGRTKTTT